MKWVMRLDAMVFIFWMLSFKPAFSLSSFTLIKRLFGSSSLSAIRVVSCAYLRLLIFPPAILIPACESCSLAFHMSSKYIHAFPILGCLGYYNQIPQIRCLTNNRHLFLTVLEAGSLKPDCQQGQFLWQRIFPDVDGQMFIVSSHGGKRTSKLPGVLLIKALTTFIKTLRSWLNHLSNTSTS